MHRFFVGRDQIDTENRTAIITGDDVSHIKNVLRMKAGEEVSLMISGDGDEYRCAIREYADDGVRLDLLFIKQSNAELPCRTVLYQALPKADKMEFIIMKAVELGVSAIVPVATERAIVRLEGGRAEKRTARWNAIAEAAAKQSKRAVIPEVRPIMTMKEAIADCRGFAAKIIPYELSDSDGMEKTRKIIRDIKPGMDVAVFIGPEGGFTDNEIKAAESEGIVPVTLGRRILRTETAGLVVLSWLVYELEA